MIEINKIYNKDCIEYMKTLPNDCIDLIIADPPYFKIVKNDWDNQWETQEKYIDWCIEWTKECCRIMKDGSLIYIWGAVGKHKEHPFLKYLLKVEEQTSLTFANWITMKNFRVFGNSSHFPFARQELLVFSKGKHNTYNKQYSDYEGTNRMGKDKLVSNVWVDCKDVSLFNKKDSHPTEKPYLAEERIVLSSSKEGDVVYIPFAGSGVDMVACINNNRNYIATELDKKYIDEIILPRINNINK
jgi:DNA modification methylase